MELFVFIVCPYFLQEGDMPEEVNIDDLIDLPTDEERVKKLQVTWTVWTFIVKEAADFFFFVISYHLSPHGDSSRTNMDRFC